jgi:hypothetical protein
MIPRIPLTGTRNLKRQSCLFDLTVEVREYASKHLINCSPVAVPLKAAFVPLVRLCRKDASSCQFRHTDKQWQIRVRDDQAPLQVLSLLESQHTDVPFTVDQPS